MRKLTDIISGMDQYNGTGPYSDEYKNGDRVDIETEFPNPPESATISESLERDFRNILGLETIAEITVPDLKRKLTRLKLWMGPCYHSIDSWLKENTLTNHPISNHTLAALMMMTTMSSLKKNNP